MMTWGKKDTILKKMTKVNYEERGNNSYYYRVLILFLYKLYTMIILLSNK